MSKFRVGQSVYFVRSGVQVIEVQIINITNNFCTIRFLETGGGIRVRESKLYATKEAAEEQIKKQNRGRMESYKPYW